MKKIPVDNKVFEIGFTLPWSVYDQVGRLLLGKGEVIGSGRQLEILRNRSVLRYEDDPEEDLAETAASEWTPTKPDDRFRSDNPFVAEAGLWHNLAQWDHALLTGAKGDALRAHLLDIADAIDRLCDISSDGILGSVQTQYYGPQAEKGWYERRQVHMAVLCALVAKRMGMAIDVRRGVIAAALTCNVAMSEFAEALQKQEGPLTPEQRTIVNAHPGGGFDLLKTAGIMDKVWLSAVMQHHERPDGSGYPLGLKDDILVEGARLLSLSEMFVAMVSPRSYRKRVNSRDALRELYMERGKQVDEKLAAFFIKELGVFPPGSCVRLANGEIAVVTTRTQDAKVPLAKALVDSTGKALAIPVVRDTKEPLYGIKDLVEAAELPAVKWSELWGFR